MKFRANTPRSIWLSTWSTGTTFLTSHLMPKTMSHKTPKKMRTIPRKRKSHKSQLKRKSPASDKPWRTRKPRSRRRRKKTSRRGSRWKMRKKWRRRRRRKARKQVDHDASIYDKLFDSIISDGISPISRKGPQWLQSPLLESCSQGNLRSWKCHCFLSLLVGKEAISSWPAS